MMMSSELRDMGACGLGFGSGCREMRGGNDS